MFASKTCLGALALGISLALVPAAMAQNAGSSDLSPWDDNADTVVDSAEFCSGFQDAGVFANWDVNEDDVLTESEFDIGIDDKIGHLDESIGEEAFGEWDTDANGRLTQKEFCEGVHAGYDADENGTLDATELAPMSDHMLEEDPAGH